MFTRVLAIGMVAGGIYALSGANGPVRAAPTGLVGAVESPSGVTDVRRRGGGGRGIGRGGRGFGGHPSFGGGRGYGSHRGFGRGRGFAGRGFYGGRHYGYRRHRGRNLFLYGALPFIGYHAYSGGYRSGCGRYWHRYKVTGSRYWHRRWRACRGW